MASAVNGKLPFLKLIDKAKSRRKKINKSYHEINEDIMLVYLQYIQCTY